MEQDAPSHSSCRSRLLTAATLLLATLLVHFSCVSCATASPPAKDAFIHTGYGVMLSVGVPILLMDDLTGGDGFGWSDGAGKSSPWAWTALPVAIPLGLVGGAVGLAIDIVCLPNTLHGMYIYAAKPPLGYCIERKDNAMLLKRLEEGADPNARYHDRHTSYPIPLLQAIRSHNSEAFEILLAHGAAIVLALILMIFSFTKSTGYTLAAFVTASAMTAVLMRAFQACFTAITNKAGLFGKAQ